MKTFYAYKKQIEDRLRTDYETELSSLEISEQCLRNNFSFGLSVEGFLRDVEKEYGIISKEKYQRKRQQKQTI